jgi:hypothetical protein
MINHDYCYSPYLLWREHIVYQMIVSREQDEGILLTTKDSCTVTSPANVNCTRLCIIDTSSSQSEGCTSRSGHDSTLNSAPRCAGQLGCKTLRCSRLPPFAMLCLSQRKHVAVEGVTLMSRLWCLCSRCGCGRYGGRFGLVFRIGLRILVILVFVVLVRLFLFFLSLSLLALFPVCLDFCELSGTQYRLCCCGVRYSARKSRIGQMGVASVEKVDSVLGCQTCGRRFVADEARTSCPGRLSSV